MDSIAEIPADQVIEMTKLFHRAFRAGGCDPICHCCCKKLEVGTKFHLATVDTYAGRDNSTVNSGISRIGVQETREVMLCADCDVEKMNKRTRKQRREYNRYRAQGGGCYRVNGQIVH